MLYIVGTYYIYILIFTCMCLAWMMSNNITSSDIITDTQSELNMKVVPCDEIGYIWCDTIKVVVCNW